MKKLLKNIILFVTLVCVLSVLYFSFCSKYRLKIQTPSGSVVYRVERALTPEEQQLGLMNRKKLAPKTGMIFLFSPIRIAHMWMKNTLIPLDMVFFDYAGRVVNIHYGAIPRDETIISSIRPVAGVLEINAGEAKKYNIDYGSQIDLEGIR